MQFIIINNSYHINILNELCTIKDDDIFILVSHSLSQATLEGLYPNNQIISKNHVSELRHYLKSIAHVDDIIMCAENELSNIKIAVFLHRKTRVLIKLLDDGGYASWFINTFNSNSRITLKELALTIKGCYITKSYTRLFDFQGERYYRMSDKTVRVLQTSTYDAHSRKFPVQYLPVTNRPKKILRPSEKVMFFSQDIYRFSGVTFSDYIEILNKIHDFYKLKKLDLIILLHPREKSEIYETQSLRCPVITRSQNESLEDVLIQFRVIRCAGFYSAALRDAEKMTIETDYFDISNRLQNSFYKHIFRQLRQSNRNVINV